MRSPTCSLVNRQYNPAPFPKKQDKMPAPLPGRAAELAALEAQLRTATAKDAHDAAARLMLAALLARTGRAPEATARLVQGSPTVHAAGAQVLAEQLDTLGGLYLSAGRADYWPEMRGLFSAARQRYPCDPRVELRLGQALAELHEPAAAEPPLRRALNLARCRLAQWTPAQRDDLARSAIPRWSVCLDAYVALDSARTAAPPRSRRSVLQ